MEKNRLRPENLVWKLALWDHIYTVNAMLLFYFVLFLFFALSTTFLLSFLQSSSSSFRIKHIYKAYQVLWRHSIPHVIPQGYGPMEPSGHPVAFLFYFFSQHLSIDFAVLTSSSLSLYFSLPALSFLFFYLEFHGQHRGSSLDRSYFLYNVV